MPTASPSGSIEVVTAALLVIGGKILSGRTKDQSVLRSSAWAQHECGAARPRCTEARAGQTRGRGHAGASAASTKRLSLGSASNINELHFCALPVSRLASAL